MDQQTIVAIATPPGRGGVGIIRLSGPQAYSIATSINQQKQLPPRKAQFCSFYNDQNELLDQGLMLYFKAPFSFTGEDVVEIHAHGSPIILDLLIKVSLKLGAHLARPGEFSERAFLNDKIDLTQAEAIADLIQASSETSARLAQRTLQGDFSKKINELCEKLIYLRLYVEAAIDFPEEEIDFLNDGTVNALQSEIMFELEQIRTQAQQGVMLREGLSIVIAGLPNAGKSTLINHLAGRDVAIVTEIAGTTRDVMREHILLDDIPVHIIDTAGLRESNDLVEQEGIRRAWEEVKRADCVLMVVDITSASQHIDLNEKIRAVLPQQVPVIMVFNKIDTTEHKPMVEQDRVYVSAKLGIGIDNLKMLIKQAVGYQPNEGLFLARRRHIQALDEANELLVTGQIQLQQHRAGELLAEDLRLAHQCLCEITGEFTSDDLLGRIFSSFCIGK